MARFQLLNILKTHVENRLDSRTLGCANHYFIIHVPIGRTNAIRVSDKECIAVT